MKTITNKELSQFQPKTKEPVVRHINDSMSETFALMDTDPQKLSGVPTKYWKLFNKAFGGLRSELIVLTADTGCGKSSFARNWLQDCVHQNIPSLLISLEEDITQVNLRLFQMELGKTHDKMTFEDRGLVGRCLEQYPLYYLDWGDGYLPDEMLFKTIGYAHEKFQTQFIVVDHLDYIKSSQNSPNESYRLADIVRRLARIAHTLKITILLIVHPSKTGKKGFDHNDSREINIDELKGTSSIKQEADAVITLFRRKDGSNQTYLRFQKIRNHLYAKYDQSKIKFQFDDQNCRFLECVNDQITYGEIS